MPLTIQIVNVSPVEPSEPIVCRYEYGVYVNNKMITSGFVDHDRTDGWAILVKKVAEEHIVVTTMERDGRVIGTQQATLRALPA